MRSFFGINQNLFFLLSIFPIALPVIFYKNRKVSIVSFTILFFVFGVWRTDFAIKKIEGPTDAVKAFDGNALVVKVASSSFGQNIIVRLENEKIDVLAQVPKYPEYRYGDLVKVNCAVSNIKNQSGGDFDYRMYMAKEGVLYSCEKQKISKIAEGKGDIFYGWILKLRSLLEASIFKRIPQPEGALASGLLFGGSGGLSKEIQDDFSRTGMTHIVAVSGYNVTIIAEYLIMLGISIGLWRKKAIWFAAAGVCIFIIMIGLPSSAVRAGVMSGMLMWAMKNGRLADSKNAIIFAAAVMLILNPLLLRWDIGFQLSFFATLGIVETSPLWEKSFIKKHKAMGISEIIALSLGAQLFVIPIIAYNFHMTSLISLLANVFILPIVPISMLLVFLVSLSALVFAPLASVFAWLAFIPLLYEVKLIHILADFPWASMRIEKFNEWWVLVFYVTLLVGIHFLKKNHDDKKQ